MEAIVLAGGLGTRLKTKLSGIPKPMAPVAGRPFLEFLLGQLERAECTRAVLSVGHLHEVIQEHFGASFRGMQLDYVIEEAPLGTGGAIRKALRTIREKSALVLNGDTYLDANYAGMLQFHLQQGASVTMAITRQPNIARYGGVLVKEHRIVGFEEKGRSGSGLINAGAYILPTTMNWPEALHEKFSFEIDFLASEIGQLRPAAFEVDGFFLDIGVPEDLDRAQIELAAFFR